MSHLTAQSIQYDTLSDRRFSWTLRHYKIRTLKGMREKLESGEKLDTIIVMEPRDFFYVRGQQETMTIPELKEFIDRQRLRGAAGISTFEVEYHKRFATPFAAFILTLIGVSLSCEKRKGGMGASIGVGIALSFTYILFQTVSSTFALNAGCRPCLPFGCPIWCLPLWPSCFTSVRRSNVFLRIILSIHSGLSDLRCLFLSSPFSEIFKMTDHSITPADQAAQTENNAPVNETPQTASAPADSVETAETEAVEEKKAPEVFLRTWI